MYAEVNVYVCVISFGTAYYVVASVISKCIYLEEIRFRRVSFEAKLLFIVNNKNNNR